VHYYFTNERKDAGGKIKKDRDRGRLTDILIKENSKWQYLAWSDSKPNDSKELSNGKKICFAITI
jgi:hypothetical protein